MIWTFPLLFIAAVAKALMDALAHGKFGVGSPFWDAALSWKNKWTGGDPALGERFLGSSTVFVAFTDGWHLSQMVFLNCVLAAIVTYPHSESNWSGKLVDFLIYSLGFRLVFELFYSKIFS